MGAHGFDAEAPGPGLAMRRRLAGFVATLREAGFAAGQTEAQDAARLMLSPMAERPERLRAAMRALFASRRAELTRFDELFDAFWRGRGVRRAVRIDAEALAARSPRAVPARPGRARPAAGLKPDRRGAWFRGGFRRGRRAARRSVGAGGDVQEGHRGVRRRGRSRPGRRDRRTLRAGDANSGSPAGSGPAGAAGGSTCARRSGSASRMAANRSISRSAAARSSR